MYSKWPPLTQINGKNESSRHSQDDIRRTCSVNHVIDEQLLRRFDVPGPRYTSYPTADRFVEAFSSDDYIQALEQRRAGSMALPLSLYVHVPFCESVCYYCACNKVITKHHGKAAEYLRYLSRELELQVEQANRQSERSQHPQHMFGQALALISVAISLAAVTSLTGSRKLFALAGLAGVGGLGLAASGFLHL